MARYDAVGFEAAAITALAVSVAQVVTRRGVQRVATVRFGHPFAVVAVGAQERWEASAAPIPAIWHGLPVFSAWIAEPAEAEPSPASSS